MFQSDYRNLLGDDARPIAEHTYGVREHMDVRQLDDAIGWGTVDGRLVYHSHCHQKAPGKDYHDVGVLRRAGYEITPWIRNAVGWPTRSDTTPNATR